MFKVLLSKVILMVGDAIIWKHLDTMKNQIYENLSLLNTRISALEEQINNLEQEVKKDTHNHIRSLSNRIQMLENQVK